MTRSTPIFAALCSALLATSCGPGQEAVADDVNGATAVSATTGADMLAHLEGRIETARDKFIQLAEAIPEDRYDWRPMDGVRSFREVFIHIAADNWAPVSMGVTPPEDVPLPLDMEWFSSYQDQHLTKEETLAEVRRSFEYILAALDQTRDRLDETVTFGGNEWNVGLMWVALATHMHEHLGQTIAYARSNEIVPPWSR